jgi:hypothetical protein
MSDLARVNVVNDTSALLAHEVASGLNPHGNDSLNETDVRRKLRGDLRNEYKRAGSW